LLRRYAFLLVLENKVLGFNSIKALYIEDEDFKMVVEDPSSFNSFTLQDGFIFKGNKPYRGALAGHFGINKTFEILEEHFIDQSWVGMSTAYVPR